MSLLENHSELREFKKELVKIAEREWHDTLVEFVGDTLIIIHQDEAKEINIKDYLFVAGHYISLELWNSRSVAGFILSEIVGSLDS